MPPGRTRWGNTRAGPVQSGAPAGRRRHAGRAADARNRETRRCGGRCRWAPGRRAPAAPPRPATGSGASRAGRSRAGEGAGAAAAVEPLGARGADAVFDAGREERSRRHLRHHAQLPLAAEQTWCPGRRHGLPATTRTSPQSSVPDLALDSPPPTDTVTQRRAEGLLDETARFSRARIMAAMGPRDARSSPVRPQIARMVGRNEAIADPGVDRPPEGGNPRDEREWGHDAIQLGHLVVHDARALDQAHGGWRRVVPHQPREIDRRDPGDHAGELPIDSRQQRRAVPPERHPVDPDRRCTARREPPHRSRRVPTSRRRAAPRARRDGADPGAGMRGPPPRTRRRRRPGARPRPRRNRGTRQARRRLPRSLRQARRTAGRGRLLATRARPRRRRRAGCPGATRARNPRRRDGRRARASPGRRRGEPRNRGRDATPCSSGFHRQCFSSARSFKSAISATKPMPIFSTSGTIRRHAIAPKHSRPAVLMTVRFRPDPCWAGPNG